MNTIMFDLDGTLLDSMHMWKNLGSNFLLSKNLKITDDVIKTMSTMSLIMSSAFLKKYYNLPESSHKIHEDFKNTVMYFYLNEVAPKVGAIEVLKKYKELGKKVLLATATNEEFVKPTLDKFGIYHYFDGIYTSDTVREKKDSPKFFDKILDIENISASSTLLFDDSEFALLAAKNSGIKTCCVIDQYSIANYEMLKKECDFYIENFTDWTI